MTTPNTPLEPDRWVGGAAPRRRRLGIWSALGVALAVALAAIGLMVLACGVIFTIGLNTSGSNK